MSSTIRRLESMWGALLAYVAAVFRHSRAIFTSGGGALVFFFWEHYTGRRIRWKVIAAICSVGCIVAMFLAWNDEHASAEWRGRRIYALTAQVDDRNAQISHLQEQLEAKQQPIVVQAAPDPEVEKLLALQGKELATLKSETGSPRKRALQLSNDILKFIADRMKGEPDVGPPFGATKEQFLNAMNAEDREYTQWMHQTASEYALRFGVRVDAVIDDMRADGIKTKTIEGCDSSNGNTFMIQGCGASIGALAEKLPQ